MRLILEILSALWLSGAFFLYGHVWSSLGPNRRFAALAWIFFGWPVILGIVIWALKTGRLTYEHLMASGRYQKPEAAY
jgi:hypothetical protein